MSSISALRGAFYGCRGSRSAKIMVVGESWGQEEARQETALVGESGKDFSKLLAEAKIPENNCFFTNVVAARPAGNHMELFFHTTEEAKLNRLVPLRGLYPHQNVLDGLAALEEQIRLIKPELIIGLGNYALWALTDNCFNVGNKKSEFNKKTYKVPTGIGQWRGSQLYTSERMGGVKFLPIYHPAAALRTFPWRYMIRHDLQARVPMAFNNKWDEEDVEFIIRPSLDQTTQFIMDLLCHLDAATSPIPVCLDLETRFNMIACVGLATSKKRAICIPFMCKDVEQGFWGVEEEFLVVSLLRKLLLHPMLKLWGQNLLFDLQFIVAQLFCKPRIADDSMIMHHTVWPGGGDPTSKKAQAQGIQQKALYNLSSLYCEYHRYWKDEGKHWENRMPEEQLWTYNCRDAIKTFEVIEELHSLVEVFQLQEQYAFQMRVANDMLLPMMLRGVNTDEETRSTIGNDLSTALAKFDQNLASLIPDDIFPIEYTKTGKPKKAAPWYTSAKKQNTLFYDVLGVSEVINKKSKTRTSGKDALPLIAKREPILAPLVGRLETRRSIGVYSSNFLEMEADFDGRMRCSYNLTGTDTFRLSSSENVFGTGGNLQNIPGGKDSDETDEELFRFDFPNVKRRFIPDVGYEIAEVDLSGADAQVVAWEAKDEDLKSAFRAGMKLHIKNARDLFPEKTKDWTDEDIKKTEHQGGLYYKVKRIVHATNYVGSAYTISERVHVTMAEAEEFQERWFYLHPGILEWHRRIERYLQGVQCWRCDTMAGGEKVCQSCGAQLGRTVGNKFGYRIVYFDRVSELLSKAVAWGPQSSVGINCNKGAISILDNVPWVELLLQVHDSLVFQYPIKYSDRLGDIKEALQKVVVPYEDPLTIPWGIKVSRKSWGETEAVKW